MNHLEALPTVAEELERKAVDELARLGQKVIAGRIDEADYSLAALAIHNVTSGLLPQESTDLMNAAIAEFPPRVCKRHFMGEGGQVITHIWRHETPGFLVVTRTVDVFGQMQRKAVALSGEPDERNKKLGVLRQHLLTKNFIEL